MMSSSCPAFLYCVTRPQQSLRRGTGVSALILSRLSFRVLESSLLETASALEAARILGVLLSWDRAHHALIARPEASASAVAIRAVALLPRFYALGRPKFADLLGRRRRAPPDGLRQRLWLGNVEVGIVVVGTVYGHVHDGNEAVRAACAYTDRDAYPDASIVRWVVRHAALLSDRHLRRRSEDQWECAAGECLASGLAVWTEKARRTTAAVMATRMIRVWSVRGVAV